MDFDLTPPPPQIHGRHELALELTTGSVPALIVTCVDRDRTDRDCYGEGLNDQDCAAAYCAHENAWDAFEVDGEQIRRIEVGPAEYGFEGGGEDFVDYIVVQP